MEAVFNTGSERLIACHGRRGYGGFLLNLPGGDNFGGGAEGGGDAAIFVGRELHGPRDGGFGDAVTPHDMVQFEAAEAARVFFATVAGDFDAIIGHPFALLVKDGDDVGAGASA